VPGPTLGYGVFHRPRARVRRVAVQRTSTAVPDWLPDRAYEEQTPGGCGWPAGFRDCGERPTRPATRTPKSIPPIDPGVSALASVGWGLVTLALAPGILAHEYAHVAACRLLGVEIHQYPRLNPFGRDAYLDHEPVTRFPTDLAIALAPLAVNVPLAAGAFALAAVVSGPAGALGLWLGGTFALTALPSASDVGKLHATAETLSPPVRPLGHAVAGGVQGVLRLPGAAGIAGALLALGLYGVVDGLIAGA